MTTIMEALASLAWFVGGVYQTARQSIRLAKRDFFAALKERFQSCRRAAARGRSLCAQFRPGPRALQASVGKKGTE